MHIRVLSVSSRLLTTDRSKVMILFNFYLELVLYVVFCIANFVANYTNVILAD